MCLFAAIVEMQLVVFSVFPSVRDSPYISKTDANFDNAE